jgi:probable F420-dependent oxidoreductase
MLRRNRRNRARPFRFAASVHEVQGGQQWRAFSRRVEELGYSTLVMADHLGEQLSPMPALAATAEATTRLRVGTLVTCNDFRHPVVHAKEVATLDVLSDGRGEWGMGAGWVPSEFEAAGIAFDAPGTRVERLQESVALMKQLFADGPVTFRGTHYTVSSLDGQPKPVQRPHPPLMIGGQGPRMLAFAAREADIVSVAPSIAARHVGATPPSETVEAAMDRQVEEIEVAAGDRFDEIELNAVLFPVAVTDSPEESAAAWSEHLGYDPDEVLRSPHVGAGTVEQLCNALVERRERWGISYWSVPSAAVDAFAPVVARLAGR